MFREISILKIKAGCLYIILVAMAWFPQLDALTYLRVVSPTRGTGAVRGISAFFWVCCFFSFLVSPQIVFPICAETKMIK